MATAYISSDELWRECASWLTQWDVLRSDHRANWPTAGIVDLANTLRDGVLLCTLLSKMDPGCIDIKDVNLKPAMAQFLCLRNIRLFLKTCNITFGIKEPDLFEELMLFDLTNFHKVLCTISKLSLCSKALKSNISGFSAQNVKTREEDDIYQSLKSVDAKSTCNFGTERNWLQFTIPSPRPEDREEEVYDDLCYVTFSESLPEVGSYFILTQKAYLICFVIYEVVSIFLHGYLCGSELPTRTALDVVDYEDYGAYNRGEEIYQDLCSLQQIPYADFVGSHPPLEKRDYVVKELVETEHNYVEVINKLKKNFMRPLQTLLRPEVCAIIFCKINELHEIHTGFLSQLLKVGTDRSVRLGSIFMIWRERFLVYGTYCANLSNACTLLQDICDKDEILNQAIIKCEKDDNNGRFKLRDVLSVPMQRILKYHLLLEKLIELTDPNHEEFQELKRAREVMLDVAGYINEAARDSEHQAVIRKLHENIIQWDISSEIKLENCGRLIKDAELKIKAHDDQKIRNRYVFIFDKVMILCKQLKGNQFAYRDMLHLPDYRIETSNNRPLLNREARWSYQWHLVKHNKSIAYTLYARSIEIKEKMIKALRDAVDNVRPATLARTNHRFEMYSYENPVTCNRCSKYLKGLMFQGYNCRICDIAVHKECIATSGRCGAPPPPPPHILHNDAQLANKLWFVGEMDRNEASTALEHRRNGTYLVRIRSQRDDRDRFALSLKTDNTVKHMKICCDLIGSEEKYYLSSSKYFNSIEELIENYQHSSLKENFERLEEHTKLEWPYRQLRTIACRDFDPQDSEHISLHEGLEVIVLCQEGYRSGWWKGRSDNQVGYFPSSYVRSLDYVIPEVY
ncbi:hypothetical protein FQA39_LY13652 [Lamprigera yunnana]|nr:hypothetical protein FQA39_LY13652 [Lamprigera yunnana]